MGIFVSVGLMLLASLSPSDVHAQVCCSSAYCQSELCNSGDASCTATCEGASSQCGLGDPPIYDGSCRRTYDNLGDNYCLSGWAAWSPCGSNYCQSRTCANLPQLQIRSCNGGICGSSNSEGCECGINANGNCKPCDICFGGINCPTGQVPTSTVLSSSCVSSAWLCGSGSMGTAQARLGCCRWGTVGGDCDQCPSGPAGRDCRATCDPGEDVCLSETLVEYQCAPSCTAIATGAPTLINPAANATISTNTTTLQWTAANFGYACPQPNSNNYWIYLKECTAAADYNFTPANLLQVVSGTTTSRPFTGEYGKSYCWTVNTSNGSSSGFGTPRRFTMSGQVTGTVYYDSGNSCSISTPWNGNNIPVSVSITSGGTDPVDSVGAYSLTIPGASSYTVSTSVPAGYVCSTACSNSCSRLNVSTSYLGPFNFFLTNSREAWWQVSGAPIYAGSNVGVGVTVSSELPQATTPLILPGAGGTAGALMRASGSVDLGAGIVSANQWNTISRYRGRRMDYAYFAARMGVLANSPQLANLNVKPTPAGEDFYFKSGDSTVGALWPTVASGEKYVVFVDGDLRINYNINVAPGGFLAFIVSGDITVAPTVTTLQGIYLSTGNFITESMNPIDDVALNISGSVIAWGSVDFNRDMRNLNVSTPAELVSYRTDLIENMPENMRVFAMEWSEVVPGSLETDN